MPELATGSSLLKLALMLRKEGRRDNLKTIVIQFLFFQLDLWILYVHGSMYVQPHQSNVLHHVYTTVRLFLNPRSLQLVSNTTHWTLEFRIIIQKTVKNGLPGFQFA